MSLDPWIRVNPVIFQGRGFAPREDQAFVIMPFGPKWSKSVWGTVRMALKESGFACLRADEQYGQQVLEDIWRGICEATIVIADVTGRNPNVYYELGIAHVLGRRVILLTQDATDVPFDIRVYRHISYRRCLWPWARKSEMLRLARELKRNIEWIKRNEPIPSGRPLADIYSALQLGRSAIDPDDRDSMTGPFDIREVITGFDRPHPGNTRSIKSDSEPDIGAKNSSETAAVEMRTREVVLLIHGIRTFANWQPMVKRVLEEIPNTHVVPIKYGYLDALRFWSPFGTRKAPIDDVRREIQNARGAHPAARISVIAHSFGTFAILEILRENPDFVCHRLVLSGSIVPRSYRWDYVRGRLGTDVVNDYGTRDIWPVLAKCFSWGYGDTGRHGFGRGATVRDRGHDFAHSDFFHEDFVRTYWKPWFEKDRFVRSQWEEDAPPASLFLSVLSILPLKLIVAGIVLFFVAVWFQWIGGATMDEGQQAGELRSFAGMPFVWCPRGQFTMGSPLSENGRSEDEDQAKVKLTKGFWLGKYEVTQGEWERIMGTTPWKGSSVREGSNYPATNMSWESAIRYCETLTNQERTEGRLPSDWRYTLPTEAQWEYACRAGTTTCYAFGDDPSDLSHYAWFDDETALANEGFAHPVGEKRPNQWGLHDMYGNVLERCRDLYQESLPGGDDPEVTAGDSRRVFRGGSCKREPKRCRSAFRDRGAQPDINLGFRLAISPVP